MAVRTVTVELRLNATAFLADGRAVVHINDDMARSFTRLGNRATASSSALNDASSNVRQLGRRANTAERHIRELREEIDRLTASALAARGPVNIINQGGPGGGGGGGRGGLRGILSAIGDVFKALPIYVQGPLLAAAAIIVAMFVSAVGAMLGAALTAVISGALLAAMIGVAAMASKAVQSAFGQVGRTIMANVKGFSLAFEGPLIQSAHDFGAAWAKVGPDVNQLFQLMATSIRPLAQGIIGFVEKAMPGLKAGMANAQPILAEFARDLPAIGAAFGYMFRQVSSGQGIVKGMRVLMILLAGTLKFVGDVIHGLGLWFDFFTRNGESMLRVFSMIPGLGLIFGNLADKLHLINAAGKDWDKTAQGAANAADDFAIGMDKSKAAATALDKAMGELNTQMGNLEQQLTGMVDANIAYEQAVDDLTEAIKHNGKSTDIHIQKGRDNVTAIEAVAKAAWSQHDAFIADNQATLGLAGATQAANAAFKASIDNLAKQMRQAGLTEAQIHQLLDQWWALANAPNIAKAIQVTTFYTQRGSGPATAVTTSGGGPRPLPGQHVFNRAGGLYMADQGLLNLSGSAQMFRAGSPLYGFAEEGTGGEAFIARNADHGRSLAIANQAARWHGGHVVAGGGGGATTVTVQLVANASAGPAGRAYAQIAHHAIRTGALQARVVNNRVVVGAR